MKSRVVDTNVLVVANGGHSAVSDECQLACLRALEEARKGTILLDSLGLILKEYGENVRYHQPPLAGSEFYRWLSDHRGTAACRQVDITPDGEGFVEFPQDPELADFDPADRKFIAVAVASGARPTVLQAVDSKWWSAREALARAVEVDFLCVAEVQAWSGG